MTDFDRGRMKALLDSVRWSLTNIFEHKATVRSISPCGITALDYAELLGMALRGLEDAEKQIEQMTQPTKEEE